MRRTIAAPGCRKFTWPAVADQPRKLDLAAQYIVDTLKQSGVEPAIQEVNVEGLKYKNIVARFGPASGSLLVIGVYAICRE